MISQQSKQQQGSDKISKQGSLTEASYDQSHLTSHFNAKQAHQTSLLYCPGKNLVGFQAEKNKGLDEKAEKSLTEQSAASQKEVNQQNFKNKPCRSIFQNFQKHLITTLRTQIKLDQNFKKDPIVHVALRMWDIFLHTNYFSKKILHFLFGVKSIIDPQLQPNIHPNFSSISSIYPKNEIQLAQEYLREQIVSQCYKISAASLLKKRRMKKGEEFLLYFQKFIEELQNGGLSRRLSKKMKNGG